MDNLSVVIVAQDEEATIGAVIEAVKKIAHEIILVDSGSTDKTVEIARSHGAVCHHHAWEGYAAQKNFAISLAKAKWILSLDADEVLTEALAAEIEAIFALPESGQLDGYRIPRILYIGDTAITHGGFYPDAQLRLFQNGKGQVAPRMVHESVVVNGKIGQLKEPMLHYAYANFDEFESAMDKYARLSAQEFALRGQLGWRVSKINEWLHPWWTFFYKYVVRGGFLDGADGIKAHCIYRDYARKKITYLRELISKR